MKGASPLVIPLKKLPDVAQRAMTMVGGILLILAASLVLTNVFIDAQIPSQIFSWMQEHIDNNESNTIKSKSAPSEESKNSMMQDNYLSSVFAFFGNGGKP